MPSSFFDEDTKPASPAAGGSFFESDVAPKVSPAEALARNAQPTEYEKQAFTSGIPVGGRTAVASTTPWTDMARGFGKGAVKTAANVGWAINKIPGIGETLVPSAGLAAENKLAAPHTAAEQLGSNIEGVGETLLPVGEAANAIKGSKYIRPMAQFAAENVLPEIKGIPYIGRGIEAAEKAPTWVKAATRGGTTGALLGGVEQAVRTRDPGETFEGALYGGLGGALVGMGAHGINRLAAGPEQVISKDPFHLSPLEAPREAPVQNTLHFPAMPEEKSGGMRKLNSWVDQEIGGPAQRNVPLREQLSFRTDSNGIRWARTPDTPAEVSIPNGMSDPGEIEKYAREKIALQKNFGGKPTFRSAPELSQPDIGANRMVKAEKIPTIVPEEIGRQMGAPPIQPNVPLREQWKPMEVPQSAQARLEAKYPDKAMRQMVHANGEEMVDAIGDDAETLKAVHDLTNPDVRQALINSGDDMGQQMVNNRKASGDLSRQDAFRKLLAKGLSPKQIVELARKEMRNEAKPGPIKLERATERENTGD